MPAQKVGSLLIDIAANVAGVKQDLEQVRREVDSFARNVNGIFKALGRTVGIGLSFGAVVAEVKSWVSAAAEAETATAKLGSVLRAHGVTSKSALEAYKSVASGLQSVTAYSDEAIMSVMRLLTAMGVGPAKIQPATEAVLRLASAFDTDLDSAAKAVAQAMEGNTKALAKFIPQIKGAAAGTMDAEKVLSLIAQTVGQASFQLDTFAKQSAAFKNSWHDVSEELGSVFLPIAKDVLDVLGQITHAMLAQSQGGQISWLEKELKYAEERKTQLQGLAEGLPSGELGITEAIADEARKIDEINRKLRGLRWERDEILKQSQAQYTKPPSELAAKTALEEESRLRKEQLDLVEKYNAAQRKLQKDAAEAYEKSQQQIVKAEAQATEDEAKQIAERLAMEEDYAKKRSEIEERLYDDLERAGYDTWEFQKKLLDDRYRDYALYIDDTELLDRAYAAELERLWRVNVRKHGDMISAMIAAWRDYKEEALSVSKTVYDYTVETLASIQKTAEDTLVAAMSNKFKDIGDLWKDLMDTLYDEFKRAVARIIVQKIVLEISASLSSSAGTGGAGYLNFASSLLGGGGVGTGGGWREYGAGETVPAGMGTGSAGAAGSISTMAALSAMIIGYQLANQQFGLDKNRYAAMAMTTPVTWPTALLSGNPVDIWKQGLSGWAELFTDPGGFISKAIGGQKQTKLQLASGYATDQMTQEIMGPFGTIGLTKEKRYPGEALSSTLAAIKVLDEAVATLLDPSEIRMLQGFTWKSDTLHGKISSADIEAQIIDRFKSLGRMLGEDFTGEFMASFSGTFEELPAFLEKMAVVDKISDYLKMAKVDDPFVDWEDFSAAGLSALDQLIEGWKAKVEAMQEATSNAFTAGITAAMTDVEGLTSWQAFEAAVRGNLASSVISGLIEGFSQTKVVQAALAPFFGAVDEAFTKAFVGGKFDWIAWQMVMQPAMAGVSQSLEALKPAFNSLIPLIQQIQETVGGVPAYQGGTPYVPQTGLYRLHEGEIVMDSQTSAAIRRYGLAEGGEGRDRSPQVINFNLEANIVTTADVDAWIADRMESIRKKRTGRQYVEQNRRLIGLDL